MTADAAENVLGATSLVELATRRLRGEILSGRLLPGERLVEEQLTRRFGISRAPLREALRLLGQQGLVEHLPRRGVRVAELSARDIDELFGLRDALERYACAPRWTIGAQAFQEVPRAHAVAVVFAIIPNIASWAGGLMTNAVGAAGSTPEQVGEDGFGNAGLVYHGTILLGGGAILAGLVLGAIVAFIIDKKFIPAAIYCFIGAALGFIGLIHAEQVGWNVGGQIALGYALAGIVLLLFAFATRNTSTSFTDEEATADEPTTEAPQKPAAADTPVAAAPVDASRPATA